MEPRKIIVNGRFLLRPVTGVERFAESIIRRLQDLRDDVKIVMPRGENRSDLPADQIGRLQGHAWEQLELPRYCRSQGSPLLLSLCSTGPVQYRRQIVAHHDITYVRHPESFSRKFRLLYQAIIPPLLRNAQAVVTVSEFSKQEIRSHYSIPEKKIRVIGNAAGPQFRPPESRSRGNYVLAVSSPNAHKNFDRLVTAVTQEDVPCDLLIVGEQPAHFTPRGEAMAGVHDRVSFSGRLSDSELVEAYQNARAFVFPSLYEGFGIPPLEAQACGTPVVAAKSASLPEVLGDSALFVDPYDPADIARGIRTMLNSSTAEDYARRGIANAASYSWDASARSLSELIDDCLVDGKIA